MQVNIKADIKLSEDDLKQIIVEYLKEQGYNATGKDIHYIIKTETTGYGMFESESTVFRGCSVSVSLDK